MTAQYGGFSRGSATAMTLRIREFPEAVLRQTAKPVEQFDRELERLIDAMIETMYAVPGIGLAAPQVGVPLRLFVYDIGHSDGKLEPKVLINPTILERRGAQSDEEGCLSVPDYRTAVRRANWVKIQGLDRAQQPVTLEGEGLLARLFQHETDHLDGHLLIDRISSLKRNIFLRRHRKRARTTEESDDST